MSIIQRVRYLIKATKRIIIIFTNYAANTTIVKQTTFVNNKNFRLIKAFIYLSQF